MATQNATPVVTVTATSPRTKDITVTGTHDGLTVKYTAKKHTDGWVITCTHDGHWAGIGVKSTAGIPLCVLGYEHDRARAAALPHRKFTCVTEDKWTDRANGDKPMVHRYVLEGVITAVTDSSMHYVITRTLEETGRPPFDWARNATERGAWARWAEESVLKSMQLTWLGE